MGTRLFISNILIMTAIQFLLLIGVSLIIAALLVIEPYIDKNEQTGKYILWYNWKHERRYIQL